MKSETVRTVILVSILGLVGYLIDQKLKKEFKEEPIKEFVMESL